MGRGTLIAPIIVAIGVIIAAIAFAVVTTLLDTADATTGLRLARIEDRLARIEAAEAEGGSKVEGLAADVSRLRDDMSLMANRAPAPAVDTPPPVGRTPDALLPDEDFENPPTEALTEEMKLARTRFNRGIVQPRNKTMLELLGSPRDSFSSDYQPMTNPTLKALIETRKVGPIEVTMVRPALDNLQRVLDRLKKSDPDIYAKVGTAGALCARLIRGSSSSISNHSWGTAIDLTLEGRLDGFADGGTQFGLLILAEYFNDEGWFWGAAYNREDSMHFEVGEEALRAWRAKGEL